MNLPKLPLAGTLLVSYAVYTTFVPVSISHSIILFSLAALTGLDLYIQSHRTPSALKMMEEMKLELVQLMEKQKVEHEVKLQELKEEQTRQSLLRANSSSSTPKKSPISF